ncbi:MAG: hypothetical protein FJ050_02765 [Cyanobacteria bacterium M_surface_7_m2_040]|nr:hypothetical protein [Cyanobacteria bacterium M_surface_7_m2_040]
MVVASHCAASFPASPLGPAPLCASPLSASLPPASFSAASHAPSPRRQASGHAGVHAAPALLAVVLSLAAVLIAPEQPHDQAAICQRHNGAAACRVW